MAMDFTKQIIAANLKKERNYWLKKLSGGLVRSNFSYDYFSREVGDYKKEAVEFCLDTETSLEIIRISNNSDQRLFMLLLTGLVVLIHKYTGLEDIVVGAPIYRQNIEGKFLNTVLALRNNSNGDKTFKELLFQVRQTVNEANEHQNYPMEQLYKELALTEGSIHQENPLFDIVILLENLHDPHYIKDHKYNLVFSFSKTSHKITGV